jgi:hypothetical protein
MTHDSELGLALDMGAANLRSSGRVLVRGKSSRTIVQIPLDICDVGIGRESSGALSY